LGILGLQPGRMSNETEMGERIRRVLVVYGAERGTAGAQEEGEAKKDMPVGRHELGKTVL